MCSDALQGNQFTIVRNRDQQAWADDENKGTPCGQDVPLVGGFKLFIKVFLYNLGHSGDRALITPVLVGSNRGDAVPLGITVIIRENINLGIQAVIKLE